MTASCRERTRNEPEFDKVEVWRWQTLVRAGVGNTVAGKLAESDADLHKTIRMVKQGCSDDLLERILL